MKDNTVILEDMGYTIFDFVSILNSDNSIQLDSALREKVVKCRQFLDDKISDPNAVFYGINTGFGSLCNTKINSQDLSKLQSSLVLSHACGMGDEIPYSIAKLIFLLKIFNLSKGYSGVSESLMSRMIELYNHGLVPQIFEYGSLGASGDLAPLAHLSSVFLGKGKAYLNGELLEATEIHQRLGIEPITLKAKEGLALLNGTQFSLAFAVYCVSEANKLIHLINIISALSLDAYACDNAPFNPEIQNIRPHEGQRFIAQEILNLRENSEILDYPRYSVQDPYSFRCIPQVHGASYDTIQYVTKVVNTELNSVTDNPNIFPDSDLIISGGNFHAQPLALVLDFLAIALAELGNISERRTYQLINGDRDLPVYLAKDAGVNSGYMIAQYSAASIVSHNKQLCTPSSVDSIVSSKGQEDHVSMAANAATKCYKVLENVKSVLAIEWMTANQAMDFRNGIKCGTVVENYRSQFRKYLPFRTSDVYMKDDQDISREFIQKTMNEMVV